MYYTLYLEIVSGDIRLVLCWRVTYLEYFDAPLPSRPAGELIFHIRFCENRKLPVIVIAYHLPSHTG